MNRRFVLTVLILMLCLGLLIAGSVPPIPLTGELLVNEEGLVWVGQRVWVDENGTPRHSGLIWSPENGR